MGEETSSAGPQRVLRAFLAAGLMVAGAASTGFGASGGDLVLSADTINADVGETFTVTVNVYGVDPFSGWQVFLSFDPSQLALIGRAESTFLPAPPNDFWSQDPVTDDGDIADLGIDLRGDNSGGDGDLGTFTFQVLDLGPPEPTITVELYEAGVNDDGTAFSNAAMEMFTPALNVGTLTIYGPTPVEMSSVRARSVGVGALVEWTTQSEVENAGFDVLRRAGPDRRWRRVTRTPIPGRLTAVGPEDYGYLDLARPGTYEYAVRSVSCSGAREVHPARGDDGGTLVTVRREDAPAVLAEAGLAERVLGLAAAGAGRRLDECRAAAVADLRRRQLARLGPPACGRRLPPAGKPARAAGVRVLASATEGRAFDTGNARPSAGDARVTTRGDGVFFVPAACLAADPARAELVTGGVRSRPLISDASGLWFFAAGYRDRYTDLNTTFVTRGAGACAPEGLAPRGGPGLLARDAVTCARATARAEEDAMFALGARGSPDPWLYARYLRSGTPEQVVALDVRGLESGADVLRVALYGYTHDDEATPDHELIVSVNGEAVGDLIWDGAGYRVFEVELEPGAIREGRNAVGLVAPRNPAIPRGHGVILDYVQADYVRRLSLEAGPLVVEADAPSVVEVSDLAAPDPWVIEVDRKGRASEAASATRSSCTGGRAVRFHARTGYRYYVAPRECAGSPEAIGAARVADAAHRVEYLAIGPERLREAIAPLLDLHRGEGLSAEYVALGAAEDAFGLGRYGAQCIVDLVRHVRPSYVLLVGDNSYDYLNHMGRGVDPMVPSVLVSTEWLCETNADALFGDLDGDGAPDVPVGRLPVRTSEELARLVAKIVDRGGPGSFPTGVLFADDADGDGDFPSAQRRVAEAHPGVVWTELYLGIHGDSRFVRDRVTESVNAGTDLVVYQGHGMTSWLATPPWSKGAVPLLDTEEAARWTPDPSRAPVAYLSTCWSAYIQRNMECAESIAETLLRSDGGAAAVIGSTTLIAQAHQEALLRDFLEGALGGDENIGEAMLAAQRAATARAADAAGDLVRQGLLDTARCYAILGDPAMPLREAVGASGAAPAEQGGPGVTGCDER